MINHSYLIQYQNFDSPILNNSTESEYCLVIKLVPQINYSCAEVIILQSTRCFSTQLIFMPSCGTAFGGLEEMFRW